MGYQHKKTRDDHIFGPGPKRILSIDGGGVRGVVSLAFLERIERSLREEYASGDPDFRLSDYYDLIGGTSTGSLIATGLAMGFSVERLVDIYLRLSSRAFVGWRWHRGVLWPKFPSAPLLEEIKRQVGEETLASDAIKTALAIVAKRFDTGSPWVFHNNPRSKYFDPPKDDPNASANRDMKLHALLRASTAAPTYYHPEMITVAEGVSGLFVDGGVSPYNNPSLLLFMMATTPSYGYGWTLGEDQLSITSIGTGLKNLNTNATVSSRWFPWRLAIESLMSVIEDCTWSTQAIMQWLGATRVPWKIDSEIDTVSDAGPTAGKLFSYARYDLVLESGWLKEIADIDVAADELKGLSELDRPENSRRLLELARVVSHSLD
jgi:Patatin-like phospholipase